MPSFRFTGTDGREFPHVSLSVAVGDVIEADENPDPMWFEPVQSSPKAAKPAESEE